MVESSVFDLSKEQLLPLLSDIVSDEVEEFDIRYQHQKRSENGIVGEFEIPTFTCRTISGEKCEFTLFVRRRKKFDEGRRQTHHYDFLKSNKVPVPSLYGTLLDSQNREVLFMEHLEENTDTKEEFFEDAEVMNEFLELMARFNSLKPTVHYAARMGWDMAERDFTMNWKTWLTWSIFVLEYIENNADKNLFSRRIKEFCNSEEPRIDLLTDVALKLTYVVPSLPVGYVHGDFMPHNTARRQGTNELVVFDFEDVLLDTRFYDIARVIGGWDVERNHPESQRDVAKVYLDYYMKHGGDSVGIEDFIREVTLVWYARKLNLWEYLPADVLGAPSYDSGMPGKTRNERLDLVYGNMIVLWNSLDTINSFLELA